MTQSREVSIVADARGLVESPRWRVWAQLEGPPDGICVDQEGAIWYADVPNSYCRRVKEGGEVLDEVRLDRGAFSCALGGPSRQTLMITAAKWFGMDRIADVAAPGESSRFRCLWPALVGHDANKSL